jgi:hypothetical protein
MTALPDEARRRSWILAGVGLLVPVGLWSLAVFAERAGLPRVANGSFGLLIPGAIVAVALSLAAMASSFAALGRLESRPPAWRWLEPFALPLPLALLAAFVVARLSASGY